MYLPLGLANSITSLASPSACNFFLAAQFSFFIMINELLLVAFNMTFLGFRYLVNKTVPLRWCLYTLVAAVLGLGCVVKSSKLAFHRSDLKYAVSHCSRVGMHRNRLHV